MTFIFAAFSFVLFDPVISFVLNFREAVDREAHLEEVAAQIAIVDRIETEAADPRPVDLSSVWLFQACLHLAPGRI